MNLSEFWDACQKHDWWYMMSDSPFVRTMGSESRKALERASIGDEEKTAILDAFRKAMHPYTGDQKTPERPKETE